MAFRDQPKTAHMDQICVRRINRFKYPAGHHFSGNITLGLSLAEDMFDTALTHLADP